MKGTQSCPTLCSPMGYTVHGILQARILEWVAISFPGDLPNPGIKPGSPAMQADSLSSLFIWVCYFINQFIELFKQLNFLEQFNLTTKLSARYRDFSCTPCPHTHIASLIINVTHQYGTFLFLPRVNLPCDRLYFFGLQNHCRW